MSLYPIFCPRCDALILAATECVRCHWHRPDDRAEVGQAVAEPLALPFSPVPGARFAIVRDSIWLAGQSGPAGALMSVDWGSGPVDKHDLPARYLAQDLCAAQDYVLIGPNDTAITPARGKAVLAFDSQTGERRWAHLLKEAYTLSPAASDGESVYVVTDNGALHVLALADGTAQNPPLVAPSETRFAPVLSNDLVLIGGGIALGQPALVAIKLDTKRQAWFYQGDGPILSSPACLGTIVCLASASGLMAIDVITGLALWRERYQPPRVTRKGALTSPAALSEAFALVGCGDWIEDRPGYALHAIDLKSGKLSWSAPLGSRLTVRPEVVGSLVMAVEDTGWVSAFDLASGRRVWAAQSVGASVKGMAVFGDYLLVANSKQLAALRYRSRAEPPAEEPAAYAARGEWSEAAVAHALRGELTPAGLALLNAGDARHALKLFQRSQDQDGMGAAHERLQDWPAAIEAYSRSGNEHQVAVILARIGRHAEAGRRFEHLSDWMSAAAEYEQASQWIDAARCYSDGNAQAALEKLAQRPEAGAELAEWLARTDHWPLAISIYLRRDDWSAAANLCQARGDLRQAFQLCWQQASWERCRALAQEMPDKHLEAQVCLQQKQYGEAARLFEDLNQWEEALQNYDRGQSFDGSLRALVGLGRYSEAASRYAAAQRYGEAGQLYRRAGEQAARGPQLDRAAAAALWRRAAEAFSLEGQTDDARECRLQAAQILAEPILVLVDVKIDSALRVKHESRLNIVIANTGYGPARDVRVALDGGGFGYKQPTAVGNALEFLPKNQSDVVHAGIVPQTPGPQVELRLSFAFATGASQPLEIGPFQAFLPVQQLEDTRPRSIHIGSFEYIGPGGLHAQDAVVIRPSYGGGPVPSPANVVEHIDALIANGLPEAPAAAPAATHFCHNCGTPVLVGVGRCANNLCQARLCVKCGWPLGEFAGQCPDCGTVQPPISPASH